MHISCKWIFACLFVLGLHSQQTESSEQGLAIAKWAEKLSRELYDLGNAITNRTAMAKRYKTHNARVEVRNPNALLVEIKENIERMVDRKIDAVRCIQQVAESEAELFDYTSNNTEYYYYNSKYSSVEGEPPDALEIPDPIAPNRWMYIPMVLNNDTHFYNIPVNTTHSSVHVPLNIYDRHRSPQQYIEWSEALDEVFVQNYKSDPSLSWQYFGSTTGVMRHYPAMRWMQDDSEIDLFDCRTRTWFIEAATCTKDVIILVDSSGSMQGMRKHIASLTISSILDTFSNNDYINVMNYSMGTNYTVPCFEDMLVQATNENINTFKKAVQNLDPDNKSNSSIALEHAFALLEKYRTVERCGANMECNQMIMLVTDGIAGNLSTVFDMYNRINNTDGVSIPVRVFTYLIGVEVLNVNEIMWAACTNRGYYSHVESLEEVTGSVYKYIPVIARPLVLQRDVHPVSWTHAYADTTYDDENDKVFNEPYRLLTSVAVPAFDKKINNENDTMTAELLGVAATDVPIDEIRKLTMPYKIGVMGYAFLVSNNGYIIMHPSFRPVFNKTVLKENYNSVDFMEVEQHDVNLPPRKIDPNSTVYRLRQALVDGQSGSFHDATLKYHYDNIRRITRQSYDYYYSPIEGTPFSLGLAMPDKYGNLSIVVKDEVKRAAHIGKNVTVFLKEIFNGSNWRVHPKWVYCKYHYLEGHEFDSPEKELLHFIERINGSSFLKHRQHIAKNQHWDSFNQIYVEDNDEVECGRITLGEDDYYCDEDLMRRLIFDAKITMNDYDDKWNFVTKRDETLFLRYNATLRFVATMSGLTRWEYIFGEDENNTKTEFGDWHSRAIDETWYKSAVLQNQHDDNSSVFSVPFEIGDQPDVLVTSSSAIFYQDGVHKIPASVVGFQFSHKHFYKRFFEITTQVDANATPCGDLLDCYVIDNSGYILISPTLDNTGKFFGEVEGAVMHSMLVENLFEEIKVYDFQGLCFNESAKSSDVGRLVTPGNLILSLINGLFANILWFFMRTQLYHMWDPNFIAAEDMFTTPYPRIDEDDDDEATVSSETDDEIEIVQPKEEEKIRTYYPCDLQRSLFIMNHTKVKRGYSGEVPRTYSRPFYIKHIRNSNLIIVAVNVSHSQRDINYTTDPSFVEYPVGVEHPCQKIDLTTLPRRGLTECFNSHPDEALIDICGESSKTYANILLFVSGLMILFYIT
ncbi:voltage-dependent calcium channel subunit alpha-2/delta-3-like [Atheta coriaria]|uniref:voltage-dependent calcium channel subunit alpha-2/delta-3-like n=1 Tax=Dalotia coriaria TaxID=877792 RepID=UPI0031F42E89